MKDVDDESVASLEALRRGAPSGLDRLLPAVYDELRRIAHRQLRSESAGHTLNTTALVHETYLRLNEQRQLEDASRAQFFALAARTMRRVLIDYARRHAAQRRGGSGRRRVHLSEADGAGLLVADSCAGKLIELSEALDRLSVVDRRLAAVVECRFFGGLSEDETAEALGIGKRTVSRDWLLARAWLYDEIVGGNGG